MHDKGYDHPLFSLELVREGDPPIDDPSFSLPVQKGALMVRGPLRRRAQKLDTETVGDAVLRGLTLHASRPADFLAYGLGPAWAGNMQHWRERMLGLARERADAEQQAHLLRLSLQGEGETASYLLGRLAHSSQLAGPGGVRVPGRRPRDLLGLIDLLRRVDGEVRAPGRAALLSRNGFGPAEQEGLARIAGVLDGQRQALLAQEEERRRAQQRLVVIRGALIGDLARFCRATRYLIDDGERPRIGQMLGLLPG